MHRIPEEDWGVSLWRHMLNKVRDSLLALEKANRVIYPLIKKVLVRKYGLTPEKYRVRFRDSQKLSLVLGGFH